MGGRARTLGPGLCSLHLTDVAAKVPSYPFAPPVDIMAWTILSGRMVGEPGILAPRHRKQPILQNLPL